jgi:predicted nucleotidyltransferase
MSDETRWEKRAIIPDRAMEAVERHPGVTRVRLVGSRALGTAAPLSDWDFALETDDFPAVARDIGSLLTALRPLAQQWDRLSDTHCWMVILHGPIKLDFIFSVPHIHEPPWHPEPSNLIAIDCHFWDWALWLRSKQLANKSAIVTTELNTMFRHLLQPMGVDALPTSLDAAVASYLTGRDRLEDRFGVVASRALEVEVLRVLNENRHQK